ncbi:MAG: ribosomal RNA small subunit methyltransferase A [Candidatus Kerfeldbacteria bacterium]|nr:ribosomal RNA small subunit methyltransferase A [Candidatus Kerfeldbacteria bacterium]
MKPDRSQGQNFVIDETVITDMVRAAGIVPGARVLEIGPGFGSLTIALLEAGATVVAVEQDRRLIPALHKLTSVYPPLHLVTGDIFQVRRALPLLIQDGTYQLVSNLPYNITSRVLREFLETQPRPTSVTVLVQQEVAERVIAPAGAMSVLSVAVQLYADSEIVRLVPPSSFWPAPAVTSAILHLTKIGSDVHGFLKTLKPYSAADFFRLVKIGYSGRRKQLHNTLAAGLKLSNQEVQKTLLSAKISPESRPQTLTIRDWIRVVHAFMKKQ